MANPFFKPLLKIIFCDKETDFNSEFDDFSIEMSDARVKKVKIFDRMWRVEEGGSVSTGVILHNGMLFFGSTNRNIYSINPENGEIIWKYKTGGIIAGGFPVINEGIHYLGIK